MRPKSSWLRQFKASWRIVEPQGFFDATLVGKKQKQSPACVCLSAMYVNFPSKYRRMQTCRYQQGLCTQVQSLGSPKNCCMTPLRYKGTFSPQFHAFGYEGRAGMLGPLLTPHAANMQSASQWPHSQGIINVGVQGWQDAWTRTGSQRNCHVPTCSKSVTALTVFLYIF